MSELTESQQTPFSPPGGTETQMSMIAFLQWYVHIQMAVCCRHSAGPPPPPSTISAHPSSPPPSTISAHPSSPPPSTISDHPSSPPPSTILDHPSSPPPFLEPAIDQEVTSSPPHPQPQLHSGNMAVLLRVIVQCYFQHRKHETMKMSKWKMRM